MLCEWGEKSQRRHSCITSNTILTQLRNFYVLVSYTCFTGCNKWARVTDLPVNMADRPDAAALISQSKYVEKLCKIQHTQIGKPKSKIGNSLRLDTSYRAKQLTGLLKPDIRLWVWSWCSWKKLRDKKLKVSQMHNIPKPPKNYTGITWTLMSSPWKRSLPFATSQEVKK